MTRCSDQSTISLFGVCGLRSADGFSGEHGGADGRGQGCFFVRQGCRESGESETVGDMKRSQFDVLLCRELRSTVT